MHRILIAQALHNGRTTWADELEAGRATCAGRVVPRWRGMPSWMPCSALWVYVTYMVFWCGTSLAGSRHILCAAKPPQTPHAEQEVAPSTLATCRAEAHSTQTRAPATHPPQQQQQAHAAPPACQGSHRSRTQWAHDTHRDSALPIPVPGAPPAAGGATGALPAAGLARTRSCASCAYEPTAELPRFHCHCHCHCRCCCNRRCCCRQGHTPGSLEGPRSSIGDPPTPARGDHLNAHIIPATVTHPVAASTAPPLPPYTPRHHQPQRSRQVTPPCCRALCTIHRHHALPSMHGIAAWPLPPPCHGKGGHTPQPAASHSPTACSHQFKSHTHNHSTTKLTQ